MVELRIPQSSRHDAVAGDACAGPSRRQATDTEASTIALRGRRAALPAFGHPVAQQGAMRLAPRVISIGGAVTEIVYRIGARALPRGHRHHEHVSPGGQRAAEDRLPAHVLGRGDTRARSHDRCSPHPRPVRPPALSQLRIGGRFVVRTSGDHTFEIAAGANVAIVAKSLRPRHAREGTWTRRCARSGAPRARHSARRARRPRVLFVFSHAATNVQVAGEGHGRRRR